VGEIQRIQVKTKTSKEWDTFEDLCNKLLNVPHSAVKAKLEEEKKAKEKGKAESKKK
jgi:hypothetical protein